MFYKVIGKVIRYTDESGQDRRANSGSTVRIDRRSEAKRMLADKTIEAIKTSDPLGIDFTLREKFTDAEPEPEDAPESKPKEVEVGSLVQVGELVGEVMKVSARHLEVLFDNGQKPKKVLREEAEVIG